MNNGQDRHPWESSSPSPEIQGLPIFDRIKSAGIVLTAEEQKNIETSIQENPELLTAMERDISVIATNPSEKTRFETLYLKGYWQRVNIDWVSYTFAKIAGMPEDEQMRLVNSIKNPLEKMRIWNYIRQAANQEWKVIDERIQAANQVESNIDKSIEWKQTQLIEMNKALESQIKDIQSIEKVPKPDIEDLKKTAQNIPELKWVPIEEIQSSDKYNNILLADYYVRNEEKISNDIDPKDAEKFKNSINVLSDTLRRPRTEKFDTLTKQIVLGENREKIEYIGKELIKSGYSNNVIWNPQDRTMIFTNEKWEKRIIDTARIPPTQRIQNEAIELSSVLPEKKENPYTKVRKQEEQSILQTLDTWARLPINGWNEVQSAPTTLERLEKSLPILDNNTESLTKRLEKEKEDAKKAGIEWETEEIKAIKGLISSIQNLRSELIEKSVKFAEVSNKERREDESSRPELSIDIGQKNIKKLWETGIGKLRNMDEIHGFLSSINSTEFGNNFSDRDSINTYLLSVELTPEQLKRIFSRIVWAYTALSWDTQMQDLPRDIQHRTILGQAENGKTRIENIFETERIRQDGQALNRADFERILWHTEQPKSTT